MLVCPTHSIIMEEHELGCVYPTINSQTCIGCQKCEDVCGYKKEGMQNPLPIVTYAAASKKKENLRKSASGGIFGAIAEEFLEKEGIVFGCSMENVDGQLVPMHIGIENKDDLVKLLGSKYVQSDLNDTYEQVKKILKNKRKVLFSGTPCQVAGLKSYLGNADISGLYTIDIICHGVPSRKFFADYLKELSKKAKGFVEGFYFRDKTFGWGLTARIDYRTKDGKKSSQVIPAEMSSYYSLFLNSEIYRESCYSCKYANLNRVGDITIGDFWCIELEHPEYLVENGGVFSTEDGVSCLLENTQRGNELIKEYGRLLNIKISDIEKVMKWNRQMREPSKHTEKREKLQKVYLETEYLGVEEKFRKELGIRYFVKYVRNKMRLKKWRSKCKANVESNIC